MMFVLVLSCCGQIHNLNNQQMFQDNLNTFSRVIRLYALGKKKKGEEDSGIPSHNIYSENAVEVIVLL